jgi:hypothetical protein
LIRVSFLGRLPCCAKHSPKSRLSACWLAQARQVGQACPAPAGRPLRHPNMHVNPASLSLSLFLSLSLARSLSPSLPPSLSLSLELSLSPSLTHTKPFDIPKRVSTRRYRVTCAWRPAQSAGERTSECHGPLAGELSARVQGVSGFGFRVSGSWVSGGCVDHGWTGLAFRLGLLGIRDERELY